MVGTRSSTNIGDNEERRSGQNVQKGESKSSEQNEERRESDIVAPRSTVKITNTPATTNRRGETETTPELNVGSLNPKFSSI